MRAINVFVSIMGVAILLASTSEAATATSNAKKGCKGEDGVVHPVGSQWQPSACTFCNCPKAGAPPMCAAQSCAPVDCPEGKVCVSFV